MYVTAHRIRTPLREEGINAYLYMHGAAPGAASVDPDENPGTLMNTLLTVDAVGGNHVRSYLDITAPDEALWPTIQPVFLQFVARMRLTPFPWRQAVGSCLFRVGMERPLARAWRNEVELLYRACVAVRPVLTV